LHAVFFNDTATTEIYTLSLHDALPIYRATRRGRATIHRSPNEAKIVGQAHRSEEYTSELQSHLNLVCRLLLEKKKKKRERNIDVRNEDHTPPKYTVRHMTVRCRVYCVTRECLLCYYLFFIAFCVFIIGKRAPADHHFLPPPTPFLI